MLYRREIPGYKVIGFLPGCLLKRSIFPYERHLQTAFMLHKINGKSSLDAQATLIGWAVIAISRYLDNLSLVYIQV